ncbi:MAG: flippase-like domain-containing protein, partial [Thermoprotei archaeon]
MTSVSRISRKTAVLTIVIVTLTLVLYSLLFNQDWQILLVVNPVIIILAVLVYLLSWVISAIRLAYLYRVFDKKHELSFKEFLYARILGGLAAYLTPSAIGGEPIRALYLSLRTNSEFVRCFALTLYEVYYDVMIVSLIAIVLSLFKLPLALPVTLVGLGNIASWILIYNVLNNIITPENAPSLAKKLLSLIEKYVMRFKSLNKGYKELGLYFSSIVSSMKFRDIIVMISLTLLIHIVASATIFTLITGTLTTASPEYIVGSFLIALIAYFYSLTIGALPTPGGAIAVEYGLSIVLKPQVVVLSRVIMYYTV